MLDRFVYRQHRRAWYAFSIERGDRVVAGRKLGEPVLDHVAQFFLVVATTARILETLVARQLRHPHRAHQLRPLMRRRRNQNVLITAKMENASCAAVGM